MSAISWEKLLWRRLLLPKAWAEALKPGVIYTWSVTTALEYKQLNVCVDVCERERVTCCREADRNTRCWQPENCDCSRSFSNKKSQQMLEMTERPESAVTDFSARQDPAAAHCTRRRVCKLCAAQNRVSTNRYWRPCRVLTESLAYLKTSSRNV